MAVMDWGGANSRFLGLVSVWAARSFDQTALRPSVIKRIRQIDVKYITHITSFGVTAWTRVTAWTCMCELPRCTVHWTRISIHWILDFKQLLLLLLFIIIIITHSDSIIYWSHCMDHDSMCVFMNVGFIGKREYYYFLQYLSNKCVHKRKGRSVLREGWYSLFIVYFFSSIISIF